MTLMHSRPPSAPMMRSDCQMESTPPASHRSTQRQKRRASSKLKLAMPTPALMVTSRSLVPPGRPHDPELAPPTATAGVLWMPCRRSSASRRRSPRTLQASKGHGQEAGGEDQLPPRTLHGPGPIRDEHSPTRVRLLDAEPQEANEALRKDHAGDGERCVHHRGTEHVRQHVADDDPRAPGAERACGVHVGFLANGERLAAHDAREIEPGDGAQGDEEQVGVPPEHHDEQDDEQHEGQCVQRVDDAHHGLVDASPEEARNGAVGNPDEHADARGQQRDGDGDAGTGEASRQQVPPDAVGTEPVRGARGLVDRVPVDFVEAPRGHQGDEQGQ